ncbi:MAG: peptidylprolyl isomerase [Bdellovibrionota bacterium]
MILAVLLGALIAGGIIFSRRMETAPVDTSGFRPPAAVAIPSGSPLPSGSPSILPSPSGSPSPEVVPAKSNPNPDLAVDANGLSKATVAMTTSEGVIKFKFYPQDAPATVHRLIELISKGFYNGLNFHRVMPGFIIQVGDPTGTGSGGSGQKLKAEFNARRHIEGTVAMARGADPDSADSQFYITLGTQPHLDRNYTVFGQVVDGMDVARKVKVGDKVISMVVE